MRRIYGNHEACVSAGSAEMESLPLFYSLNRFIDHEACISAGSAEICRASFVLDVIGEDANGSVKRAVERKLDTCGSVSITLFLPTCRISKTAGSMDSRKLFSLV